MLHQHQASIADYALFLVAFTEALYNSIEPHALGFEQEHIPCLIQRRFIGHISTLTEVPAARKGTNHKVHRSRSVLRVVQAAKVLIVL